MGRKNRENFTGTWFTSGLMGTLLKIVFAAIVSHRPYRPSLSMEYAIREISQNKGVLYDPEVVNVCLRLFNEKRFNLDKEDYSEW